MSAGSCHHSQMLVYSMKRVAGYIDEVIHAGACYFEENAGAAQALELQAHQLQVADLARYCCDYANLWMNNGSNPKRAEEQIEEEATARRAEQAAEERAEEKKQCKQQLGLQPEQQQSKQQEHQHQTGQQQQQQPEQQPEQQTKQQCE